MKQEDYIRETDPGAYLCEACPEDDAPWVLSPMPEWDDDDPLDRPKRWICQACYDALPTARVAAHLKDGICCPACGEPDEICGDSVLIDGNEALQCQSCASCDASWMAIFTLSRCRGLDTSGR